MSNFQAVPGGDDLMVVSESSRVKVEQQDQEESVSNEFHAYSLSLCQEGFDGWV